MTGLLTVSSDTSITGFIGFTASKIECPKLLDIVSLY